MNHSGRWSQLKDILDAALSLDDDARGRYVQAACAGDSDLLAEVREYLEQDARMGSFLGGSNGPVSDGSSRRFNLDALFHEYLQSASVSSPVLTQRFQQIEKIGAGGFGEVYRAHDRARGQTVAIKVSRLTDRETVGRFKREFRSLAGVTHPNIVALYELFGDDVRWFFTMEYLSGLNFREYVRSAGMDVRFQQLRRALSQLVDGLNALHRANIVHRDIKPSNVWVTESGRVVLLDFGLVQTIHEGTADSAHPFAGTPHYCSPEQAAGGLVTAASDWYAVGVMLYEALTGRLPFPSDGPTVLKWKQEQDGPPPGEHLQGIPPDLDELCRSLLRRDPQARMAGLEIAGRVDDASVRLVGRAAESAVLRDAWDEVRQRKAAAVVVTGESGFGKSLLLSNALAEMRQQGAVVFSARCYATESVPYRGVDELVDLLGRYLRSLHASELDGLLPVHFPLLMSLFPALGLHRDYRPGAPEITDVVEMRQRAFQALWELFARLSERVSLVLAIDDLQWGDLDSLPFFIPFLTGHAPPVLLLLAYRQEDAESSPLLKQLQSGFADAQASLVHTIRLEPLEAPEGKQLTSFLLARHGLVDSAAMVDKIVQAAGGDPFLISEFTRCAASFSRSDDDEWDSAGILRTRLTELPRHARRLLEMVAVAGQPLDLESAARAWDGAGDLLGARRFLMAESLLRMVGESDALVAYHDRIREAAVGALDGAAHRSWHGRLALALEASENPDPERLADHLDRAEQRDSAARYARLAADRARKVFAFERAAHFYDLALRNTGASSQTRRELQSMRAEALGNAGRGPESASCYLAAAEGANAGDSLRFHSGAVGQYLRSGHLTTALDMLPSLMDEIGVTYPANNLAALVSLLWARLRMRTGSIGTRKPRPASADQLAKMDICWSVALGISMVDPLRSALFSARHLLFALRLGEPGRLAMALAGEATQRAAIRGGYGISDRLMSQSFELAERSTEPRVTAFVIAMHGVLDCLRGEWKRCYANCAQAAALFRECQSGPGWELTTSVMFTISMQFLLGEWPQVLSEMPGLLREAEQRGERYATLNFQLLTSYYFSFLIEDEPAKAEELARRLLGVWDRDTPDLQHYYAFTAIADSCIYAGDGDRAWNAVQEFWPSLQRAGIFYLSLSRIFGSFIRAKCALVKAASLDLDVKERSRLLNHVSRLAKRLVKERFPYARAGGRLLEAAVAAAHGRRDSCLRLLSEAITLLGDTGLAPWRVSAEYWRAYLTGDSSAMGSAENWMRERGCLRPDRIAALFAPGEWHRVAIRKFSEMR